MFIISILLPLFIFFFERRTMRGEVQVAVRQQSRDARAAHVVRRRAVDAHEACGNEVRARAHACVRAARARDASFSSLFAFMIFYCLRSV